MAAEVEKTREKDDVNSLLGSLKFVGAEYGKGREGAYVINL
jgi:hypothetical protein